MAAPKIGILGQGVPNPGPTAVYTVGAGRRAVVSTLSIAETGGSTGTFRLHACINGAAAAVGNAISYGVPFTANSVTFLTLGITLAAGDVLSVYSSTGTVTFTVFGEETDVPTA